MEEEEEEEEGDEVVVTETEISAWSGEEMGVRCVRCECGEDDKDW